MGKVDQIPSAKVLGFHGSYASNKLSEQEYDVGVQFVCGVCL